MKKTHTLMAGIFFSRTKRWSGFLLFLIRVVICVPFFLQWDPVKGPIALQSKVLFSLLLKQSVTSKTIPSSVEDFLTPACIKGITQGKLIGLISIWTQFVDLLWGRSFQWEWSWIILCRCRLRSYIAKFIFENSYLPVWLISLICLKGLLRWWLRSDV